MANKPERIIIDTNLLISFLISNSYSKLDKKLKDNRIRLIFSEELLREFTEVISRPKLKKYFLHKDVLALMNGIEKYADIIPVRSNVTICRDKKDNFLLSLCKDSKADFLLTGDEDLLVLKKFHKTSIIKISEYLAR